MLMPVFSSPQIPVQVRLFVALAVSLSVAPLVVHGVGGERPTHPMAVTGLISAELGVGIVMGASCRLLFSAVQFAGSIIAPLAGFSGVSTVQDGTGEIQPELGALLTISIAVSTLALDIHMAVVKAAVESFVVLPLGIGLAPDAALERLVAAAAQSASIAIQLAAPFIIGSILLNFAFGIVNKIAPQIPVIFVSAPFLMSAALWLLLQLAGDMTAATSKNILSMTEGGLLN